MTTKAQLQSYKKYDVTRNQVTTFIRLPKELHARIKQNALELKLTMLEYLTQLTNTK